MRFTIPLSLLAILFLFGCEEQDVQVERRVAQEPEPDDVEEYVKYVVFKEPSDPEDGELLLARAEWNLNEQRRCVKAAIPLLQTKYAEHVLQRVMYFVAMERDDGYPAFRKWLRGWQNTDSEPRLKLLLAVHMTDISTVPEWFDIWSSMAFLEGSGPYLRTGVMNQTYPTIDWLRSDEAACNLWTGFFHVMEKAKKWRGYATDKNVGLLQAEWRTEVPKWLKENPEARSYWIQKYYKSLRDRYQGNKQNWPKRADRLKKAMERYDKEFKNELADRRGICADFLDK